MTESREIRNNARVYLFGAGASYPCIPLARGVSQGMIDWGKKVENHVSEVHQADEKESLAEMSHELLVWGDAASLHYSVDTLAKKLFLTNKHQDIWRLKAAISAYFMLQQTATPVEQRYDSFFAAILEESGRPPALPDDTWLLTWNYDRQFEKAYHQYCPDATQVQENITFCKRVIRLNGLLGRAFNKGTGDEYNLSFESDKILVFERVAKEYSQLRTNQPTMTFAFEKNQTLDSELKPLSEKTCTLIVIGYSFPFFNRRFDKLVLDSLPKVNKVFVQVLPEHAKAVQNRMRTLRDLPEIKIVDDREQFFVPYDYE